MFDVTYHTYATFMRLYGICLLTERTVIFPNLMRKPYHDRLVFEIFAVKETYLGYHPFDNMRSYEEIE